MSEVSQLDVPEASEPAVQSIAAAGAQAEEKAPRRKQRKAGAASDGAQPVAAAKPAPGSRQQGTVLRLNGTFGFIQAQPGNLSFFFHASDLHWGDQKLDLKLGQKVDLGHLVAPGDAADFTVAQGAKGQLVAKEVHIASTVPAGKQQLPAAQEQQQQPKQDAQQQPSPAVDDMLKPAKAPKAAAQAWLRGTIQKLPASSTVTNWRSVEKDPLGSILVEPASVPLLAPLLAAQQPAEAQPHKPSNGNGHAPVAEAAEGSEQLADGTAEPAPVQLSIHFKRSGLQNQQRPVEVGDAVRFQLFLAGKQDLQAHKIQTQPRAEDQEQAQLDPAAPRFQGFVYSFNPTSGRGAIRRADGGGQLPFSLQSVTPEHQGAVAYNAEVEFCLGPEGHQREAAKHLTVLPMGTITAKQPLPGRIQGLVMRMPGQGSKGPKPGAIRCDEGAVGAVVSFKDKNAEEEDLGIELGDEVSFTRMIYCRSGAVWAQALHIVCKAAHRRELGQVAVMKPQFGFLKCCERRGDLFFHYTSLGPGLQAEDLKVGDDVEFSVAEEPQPPEGQAARLMATEVQRAPQGSAVFETVAERPMTGAVLDLPLTRGYATTANGVLEFVDDERGPSRLTFAAEDVEADGEGKAKLAAGDRVTFLVATRIKSHRDAQPVGGVAAQHAGRRATKIRQQRFEGSVFSWKPESGYGFIAVADAAAQGIEGRLYFNQGELQGFSPSRGQAVEGIVGNNSRAQPIARQITPGTQVAAPATPEIASSPAQRPQLFQKLRAPGSETPEAARTKPPPARLCKGPDGTRGFAPGRGRGLPAGGPQPAAAAPGASSASSLPRVPSAQLNPTATSFVPAGSM